MSGKVPRRRPAAINPNDNILDELLTSPVMKGFTSFLNVKPTVGPQSHTTVGKDRQIHPNSLKGKIIRKIFL